MVLIRSFKETRLNVSGSDIEASCLNIQAPLPADDHRGIFPNSKHKSSGTRIGEKESNDVEDSYYLDFVATSGTTFFRETSIENGQPRSIVSRILQQSHVLELDPVDLNSTSLVRFRKIRIHSPARLFDNCITISEDKSTDRIVVDFITETSYLYTISFSFLEFIDNSSQSLSDEGNSLNEHNSADWRSIKYPYSFDLKKPQLMYAVSANVLVAGTTDGTLLKMERQTPLSEITTYIFNDPSNTSGLARILPWGQNDRVPGNSGISLRTVVSMTAIPYANLLVTVSINRILRIWSLETMSLLEERELTSLQDLPQQQKILIGPEPMNLLNVPAWTSKYIATKSTYLASFLPSGDGFFKIWQLNLDPSSTGQMLVDLGDEFSVEPKIPDNFSTWLVNDFHIIDNSETKNDISLSVMWKSNTSSAMYQISLPSDNQDLMWHVACDAEEVDLHYANSGDLQEDKTQYYLGKIFGPNGYARETIETALPIYGSHYAIQLYTPDQANGEILPLQDRVCQTVGTAVTLGYSRNNTPDYNSYKADLSQEWARFDRLCSELQRQGNEVLSLKWDPVLESFWIVKASFASVVRPALPIEMLYFNRSACADQRILTIVADMASGIKSSHADRVLGLMDTLYTFRRNLSHIHYNEIVSSLIEDYNQKPNFATAERMHHLFDFHLDGQVSEAANGVLNNSLQGIENVDELIEFIHVAICSNFASNQRSNTFLTASGTIAVSNALFEVLKTARLVVTDILLVLLATLKNEQAFAERSSLYTKFLRLLKSINLIFDSMYIPTCSLPAHNNLKVNGKSTLEPKPGSKLSFFQTIILNQRQSHFQSIIGKNGFAQVLGMAWKYFGILGQPSNAARLVAQLLAAEDVAHAQEMSIYLDANSFSSFVWAHVCLKNGEGAKARALFRTASVDLAQRSLSNEELEIINILNSSTYSHSTFGHGLSSFFVDVSRTASLLGMMVLALQFARDSQLNLGWGINEQENKDSGKIMELHQLVYRHMFETALKASSYDDAYSALMEINLLNSYEDEADLAETIQESKTLPYVESLASAMTLSGNGSRLCQYPFIGLTNLVTQFFFEKAEKFLGRSMLATNGDSEFEQTREDEHVFLYYGALYSWNIEHHDFRGGKFCYFLEFDQVTNFLAATALYMKIQHLQTLLSITSPTTALEEEIRESYTILINTLSCLAKTERWIVVTNVVKLKPANQDDRVHKIRKIHNRGVQRVALKLEDIRSEYQAYVDRKRLAGCEKLTFNF